MIDYETYKEMHPPPQGIVSNIDDLGYDKMGCNEPPLDDGFVLCLPVTIPGYNMQKKVWGKMSNQFRTFAIKMGTISNSNYRAVSSHLQS
jgi:hypothetical protein